MPHSRPVTLPRIRGVEAEPLLASFLDPGATGSVCGDCQNIGKHRRSGHFRQSNRLDFKVAFSSPSSEFRMSGSQPEGRPSKACTSLIYRNKV